MTTISTNPKSFTIDHTITKSDCDNYSTYGSNIRIELDALVVENINSADSHVTYLIGDEDTPPVVGGCVLRLINNVLNVHVPPIRMVNVAEGRRIVIRYSFT